MAFEDMFEGYPPIPMIGIMGSVLAWVYFSTLNSLTREIQLILLMIGFGSFVYMFQTKEKRLIDIQEAMAYAYREVRRQQVEGNVSEGSLEVLPQATLRRVDGKPDRYEVGIKLSTGKNPVFAVSINCYSGKVERIKQTDIWTVEDSPDIKVMVPPDVLMWGKMKKHFEDKGLEFS